MTSNNETVSRQKLWAGNIVKSMTSGGNSALLPANGYSGCQEYSGSYLFLFLNINTSVNNADRSQDLFS